MKHGQKNWVRSLLVLLIALVAIVPQAAFASSEKLAKTSPPPPDMVPFGSFHPSHIYLLDGFVILSNLGGGNIRITGSTLGYGVTDVLGMQMTLQRWNGTSWVNISVSPDFEDTNLSTYNVYSDFTVATGFYYRVNSVHWAEHGTTFEQGGRTGASMLVN